MKRTVTGIFVFALLFVFMMASGPVLAQTKPAAGSAVLKISHQWPGGTLEKGDFRDRLCRIFAKKVEEKTSGALKFEIHPASVLFKTVPQYDAMLKGALDMSVYPLDSAAVKVPHFSIP